MFIFKHFKEFFLFYIIGIFLLIIIVVNFEPTKSFIYLSKGAKENIESHRQLMNFFSKQCLALNEMHSPERQFLSFRESYELEGLPTTRWYDFRHNRYSFRFYFRKPNEKEKDIDGHTIVTLCEVVPTLIMPSITLWGSNEFNDPFCSGWASGWGTSEEESCILQLKDSP